jgi:hypothetical protein
VSHLYEMQLEVAGFKLERAEAIRAAAVDQWVAWADTLGWNGDSDSDTYMEATAEGRLYAGEPDYEFARRVQGAVWEANEGYCQISLVATDLENTPFERFEPDESDYDRWRDSLPAKA